MPMLTFVHSKIIPEMIQTRNWLILELKYLNLAIHTFTILKPLIILDLKSSLLKSMQMFFLIFFNFFIKNKLKQKTTHIPDSFENFK